jgi:hypothetical protein
MKICYFAFDSIGSVFTPLLLDDAIIHAQDLNCEVQFVYCDAFLPACGINYFKSNLLCKECVVNRELLIGKYRDVKNLKFIALSSIVKQDIDISDGNFDFENIKEIKDICYKGINIGLGVVSSFVSKTRNLDAEINEVSRTVFENLLKSACLIIEATLNLDKENNFDEIRLCNGRLITERAVFETAKFLKKEIKVLELSNSSIAHTFKKVCYNNALPHDITNTTLLIEEMWEKEKFGSRKAKEFYENRKNGRYASQQIFTQNQEKGRLPDGWAADKRNFVIFNSSEDEFFAIGGQWDEYKIFNNQLDGICYLAESASNDKSIHFYLRIHPNLKEIKYKYVTDITNRLKRFDNITVISGDSPVSTYTLIDYAEKCIVFGSSVGVEANYWGKPIILLGGAMYSKLDVAYYPSSLKDLDFLLLKYLEPKSKTGALKFGLYVFGERGDDFKYIDFSFTSYKVFNKTFILNNYLSHGNAIIRMFYRLLRFIPIIISYNRNKKLYLEN